MHDLALKYHRRWTMFSVAYPKSRQCFNDGITVKSNGRKYLIIVKIANFRNIFPEKKTHISLNIVDEKYFIALRICSMINGFNVKVWNLSRLLPS